MQYQTFCAANSGVGFISFFNTILDEKNKTVYYIKGGPGCGKSTLMRKIAEQSADAELILCSGDPESLDGVILPNRKAIIIDATAPHSHEPVFPGIGGHIVDLGIGWEPQKLNKSKIMDLMDKKAQQYQKCYKILSAGKELSEGVFAPLAKNISYSKITAIGDKILKQNALWEHRSSGSRADKRFLSGITSKGLLTHTDTLSLLGKNIILLEDRFLQSSILLKYLDNQLNERGIYHINGYHPLFGEPILHHLIIPEANLSIATKDGIFPLDLPEENIQKNIHLQATIDKDYLSNHKNKLLFYKRIQKEMMNLAVDSLAKAASFHQKIEEEYAKGYSFEQTEALKTKLMNNLFC